MILKYAGAGLKFGQEIFVFQAMVLGHIKRIAQRQKHSFHPNEDQQKAVVDAEQQSILKAPLIAG